MRLLSKLRPALVLLSMCASCTPEVLDDADPLVPDASAAEDASAPEAASGAEAGDAQTTTDCYSPTANLETVWDQGAVGCSCSTEPDGSVDPNDPLGYYFADNAKCVLNSLGSHIALFCTDEHWLAGHDGPCSPYLVHLHECYSPSANLDKAYEKYSVGCKCDPGTASVCVADSTGRNVALICENSRWRSVEDGPCLP